MTSILSRMGGYSPPQAFPRVSIWRSRWSLDIVAKPLRAPQPSTWNTHILTIMLAEFNFKHYNSFNLDYDKRRRFPLIQSFSTRFSREGCGTKPGVSALVPHGRIRC